MRRLILALCACGSPASAPQTFEFGPYPLAAGQEVTGQCVSATLHNDEPLYINAVELATGPGFHHSNWFWVPESDFAGPDGTWQCADRNYDEAIAGVTGGVLFAQSTQAVHEIQQFPDGMAIVVPAHSRILAGTHLLNATDAPESVSLALTITPIEKPATLLAAMSFVNESITLPPHRTSRFTMDCDLDTAHRSVLGRPVDLDIIYALGHYHALGRGITIDALAADGSTAPIFETTSRIGDALGGRIAPSFSMTGFAKLRFSCNYDNPTDLVVHWGVGTQEMCAFLSFTDSEKVWFGGVIDYNTPATITDDGTLVEYTYPCKVINAEPNR